MPGFFRLRVGRFRAIFQQLGPHAVLHRVESRGDVYAEHGSAHCDSSEIARGCGRSLLNRALTLPRLLSHPTASSRIRVQRQVQQNPLTPFTDAELAHLGLPNEAISELRLLAANSRPTHR